MPLLLGSVMMAMMYTWRRGTAILAAKTKKLQTPLTELIEMLERSPPHREPGTAVFLTGDADYAPSALLHNLKHNKVLHERNVVLTVEYAETPHIPEKERVRIEQAGESFTRIVMQIRIHGRAERSQGFGHYPHAGMAVRHHVDIILPVPTIVQGSRQIRDAALAGSAFHRPRGRRARRDRVFQDSHRSCG